MKGLADYIIASVDEFTEECERDLMRKESDEIRQFIHDCEGMAQDDTTSALEMFYLLKGYRFWE